MTRNTGLLTERCDPYGAESRIQLMGGLADESQVGKYHWYCKESAAGRFRMVCRGGDYGERRSPDGGLVAAYHCDGGHKGQVMALCTIHVAEFSQGPPPPGFDRSYRPVGQVGGTKANEMCPACMWPPEARSLQGEADALQQEMARYEVMGMGLVIPGSMVRQMDDLRSRLGELAATGRVHKCPLRLVEVS